MKPPQRYDVVILGAGIAGLCAADRLAAAGRSVAVVESTDLCGGAHRSITIGPYTFDYGSIFYEENAALFGLAPGLREACPEVVRHQRRIGPSGGLLHYPVEPRELLKTSWWSLLVSAADLAWCRLTVRRDGSLSRILRQQMGRRFLRLMGLENYIVRFHHIGVDQIDERFFFQRMGFIAKFTQTSAIFKTAWRTLSPWKQRGEAKRRPLRIRPQSGFDALFVPIRARLEERGVTFHFNEKVRSVTRLGEGHRVETRQSAFETDCLVNTIPLDDLHQAVFGETSGLVLLDMTILFVSADRLDRKAGNVLFNFHTAGEWKRATIYSRLYPQADTEREFFAVEVTIPQDGEHDPERSFADFASHVEGLGLASGCRLEGSAFHPHCYPLYLRGTDAKLAGVLARIAGEGIVTAGRQGKFEYLPTSSGVIRQVRRELEDL